MILILTFAIVVIVYSSLKNGAETFSPIIMFIIPWVVVSLYSIFSDGYFDLHDNTIYILFGWLFLFCFSNLFIARDQRLCVNFNLIKKQNFLINRKLLMVMLIFINLFALMKLRSIGQDSINFFAALRTSALAGKDNLTSSELGMIFRFQPPLLVMLLREIWFDLPRKKVVISLLVLYQLISALAIMSKFAFISPIIAILVMTNYKHKIRFWKIIFIVAVLFVAIMFMQYLRDSSTDFSFIPRILGIYIYSPIVAFDYLINSKVYFSESFGQTTFGFLYTVYQSLFGSIKTSGVSSFGWYFVPYPTNVFTGMFGFYVDFGLNGIFFSALFFGWFYGWLLNCSRKSFNFLLLYCLLLSNLFMLFFGEIFFASFSLTLQYLFWILLFDMCSKYKFKSKEPYVL